MLEKDEEVHLRIRSLYEEYQALSEIYTTSPNIAEGDFSERLLTLSEGLTQDYGARYGGETERRLTSDEVTALMHSSNLRDIQAALSRYLKHKQEVWILFDNLDKGWSTHGLAKGDVVILRCLIDAARKIQRQMRRDGHDFYVIVFVRNDVYQLLMDESSDFGKETRDSPRIGVIRNYCVNFFACDWFTISMMTRLLSRYGVASVLVTTTGKRHHNT